MDKCPFGDLAEAGFFRANGPPQGFHDGMAS
jgi:hypothetical protein